MPLAYPTDWLEAFISLRESTSAHLEKVSVAAKMNRCPLSDRSLHLSFYLSSGKELALPINGKE